MAATVEDPIPIPGGGELRTLLAAGNHIQSLSKAKQQQAAWQVATEALLVVVTQNGPTMFARIGIMLALYPPGERVFNPNAKEHHWGKRKLKRDQ